MPMVVGLSASMLALLALFFQQLWPVAICLFEIPLGILIEVIADADALLHKQASVDNLPGLDINRSESVAADAVGAITAELGFVLGRLAIKSCLVFGAVKLVDGCVVGTSEFRTAFDRSTDRKKGHRVVPLDRNPALVEIE